MSIASRITSIEEHIKESYQELEGIGIDTTEVDKNLENIPKLIDGYWETLPKVTGEGTSITLDNTKEGKMKIGLKGNTSQATSILPSEYTQVDYIQSSGTQYIDTGYLAKGDLKVITDIEYTSTVSGNQFIYGGRDSAELNTNSLLLSNNGTKIRNDYNTTNSIATPNVSNVVAKWHIVKDKGSLTMTSSDNQNITKTITNATFSSSYNVYIFGCNNASNLLNPASYRLYTFKMYDNDVLVRDYIPCYRNSDNEIGLYDLVNNVFYTNAGTGAFTYGAIATLPNPDFPIPINVVSGDNSINVCGKNLISNDIVGSVGWGGTTINYEGTSIKISKSGTGGISANAHTNIRYFPLTTGKTYTFSMNYKSGTIVNEGATYGWVFYIFGVFADGSTSGTDGNRWTCSLSKTTTTPSNHITFTPNKDFIGFKLGCYIPGGSPKTDGDVYFDCQVEVGEATTFEEYKGASYPIELGNIELCKIGDYQDRIYKSSGKNLFDKNNINGLNAYLDTTNNKLVSNNNNKSIYISCKPNTTYTISKTPSKRFGVAYTYTTPENNTAIYGTITNYDGASITITTDANAQYLVVWLINSNISGEISYQTAIDTLQIEYGNQVTTYEPYGKVWYLHKEIKKKVLNGIETWTYTSVTQGSLFRTSNTVTDHLKNDTYSPYSNYYKGIPAGTVSQRKNNQFYIQTNFNYLDVIDNRYTNANDFKNWILSNNVTIYYILATPTTTEITDSTLISQLEALNGAKSYTTQTNINQTNNDNASILNASALSE